MDGDGGGASRLFAGDSLAGTPPGARQLAVGTRPDGIAGAWVVPVRGGCSVDATGPDHRPADRVLPRTLGRLVTTTSSASRPHARTRPRTSSRELSSSQAGQSSSRMGGSGPPIQWTDPSSSSTSSPGSSQGQPPSHPLTYSPAL